MPEQPTKLRPDRDLQCYFQRPSAAAALSDTSATGFTVSGAFRQQFDWAVVEWNRDNVFEHPALRPLPDGDLSGIQLSYEEERTNCMAMDCKLWPTVDWPFLRVWATGADAVEREYKVPLKDHATPIEGDFAAAQATFELGGTVTASDYVELVWEAGDGVSPWLRHATHMMYYNDTLAGVAQGLADAINANTPDTGMAAAVDGTQITLQYASAAGANGNRVGAYANVGGSGTETWQPSWRILSGGTSPTTWRVDLDFSSLQGYVGPDFTAMAAVPTGSVRRMRWTWAPAQQSADFLRTEFQVTVANWAVTGTGAAYMVAGPGSWRVEDDSPSLTWAGTWQDRANGNYSGGSIRPTDTLGASVSYTYTAVGNHTAYLGTRKFLSDSAAGAQISIAFDGTTRQESLAMNGVEDTLVRIKVADAGAGAHTVTATHAGNGVFYFDFFEIAIPSAAPPAFAETLLTTLATDWDTDHSIALAPERTAWLLESLGFHGRANHYAGAMWFYELTRPGHQYASATVTFTGTPDFGAYTNLQVDTAAFQHLNLVADTAASIAKAFELELNAGATAVWGRAQGATLTIWSRTMGTAGNGMAVTADTGESQDFTAQPSGPLSGGADGDIASMPWADGWRTDLSSVPRLNRAARDWHSSYFRALKGYGIDVAAAFSMELQHGDPTPQTGIAQQYPDGSPALLNTPAVQTNFSPASTAFWQQVYLEMADLMSAAGITPYLQFGEVQWWYNAAPSGMPFYDAYTASAFQAEYGRPMAVIPSQNALPDGFQAECAFLPKLIGEFTQAIIGYVRAAHADARFEALYPMDTNDTPLNKIVNYPTDYWTPANLTCLKTENFLYTGNRDLNQVRNSIQLPMQLGFPPAQSSHLVGIGDYTTPWRKERRLALAKGVESVVLFALDQFCLIGYSLPLRPGLRRAVAMGSS
ncbi:MAG: hypothetical protein ABSC23_08740 [Bryobacteraceae bacterium]|jgi:hypothetical protein